MTKAVSPSEWQTAMTKMRQEEDAAFKQLDAVILKRQELPMVEIPNPGRFKFDGPSGSKYSLLDLFEDRQQLIIYNFMLYDNGTDPCVHCSFAMDHIPVHTSHLNSRETNFVVTAPASAERVTECKERMGWKFPFYSCRDTIANAGAEGEDMSWKTGKDVFGYASFFREGDKVYHTYSAKDRACEPIMTTIALLKMTKLGVQDNEKNTHFPLHDQC